MRQLRTQIAALVEHWTRQRQKSALLISARHTSVPEFLIFIYLESASLSCCCTCASATFWTFLSPQFSPRCWPFQWLHCCRKCTALSTAQWRPYERALVTRLENNGEILFVVVNVQKRLLSTGSDFFSLYWHRCCCCRIMGWTQEFKTEIVIYNFFGTELCNENCAFHCLTIMYFGKLKISHGNLK